MKYYAIDRFGGIEWGDYESIDNSLEALDSNYTTLILEEPEFIKMVKKAVSLIPLLKRKLIL